MIQQPFHFNGGIIRARSAHFFEGDGAALRAPLTDGRGRTLSRVRSVQSVYQMDWQGRRMLSPYPRTNLSRNSGPITGWSVNASGVTSVTAAAADAPNGDSRAALLVQSSGGNNVSGIYDVATVNDVVAGEIFYYTVHAKQYSGTPSLRMTMEGSAFSGGTPIGTFDVSTGAVLTSARLISSEAQALANGWWRFMIVGAASSDGVLNLTLYAGTSDPTAHFLWGTQLAREPGVYIPTSASPVTLTDWALDGTDVVLGQAPPVGALLDWTGVAFR